MIKLFYSYSHKDEVIREKLETHLSTLKNAGYITEWYDRKILPGEEWDKKINDKLDDSDIILLLISSDFLASDYCYGHEVKRAIELHNENKVLVLPIILRYCDWKLSDFEHLQCLPKDAKPVCSSYWENEDLAFLNVVEGIKKIVIEIKARKNIEITSPYVSKVTFSIGGFDYYIDKYILDNNSFVGIDFGTSTTVVSLARLDKDENKVTLETISFDFNTETHGAQKSALIPSALYFDEKTKTLYSGNEAKLRRYSSNTIEGVNYLSSFKMGLGKDMGNIYINSAIKSDTEKYRILNPKDATKEYFKFIKNRIDQYIIQERLPSGLKLCVSIPASFEANQRRELLEVIKEVDYEAHEAIFIDEPNAAFLNYIQEELNYKLLNLNDFERQYTLVFDFGAGTCDISILEFGKKNKGFYSRNIAISKFEQLGGDDIDKVIAKKILFTEFCEINELDIDAISDIEYKEIFEEKLKLPAESLKIKVCDKLKRLKDKAKKDATIFLEETLIFRYKGKEYYYDSQSISFGQFEEIMATFIKDETEEDFSIYFIINSALRKAKMNKNDIDNILLIGGSCKNPLIGKSLRENFPNVKILFPTDLQLQVSKGTAIHSVLSLGLNKQLIAPIVSESISILLYEKKHLNIIQQGEEIPHFKAVTDPLTVQRNGQTTIEMPIFVSGEKKMLQNIVIKNENGFLKSDEIWISAEIDRNKIVTFKVICNNKPLEVFHISPFANEVLSPYKRAVKEIEREINNLLSNNIHVNNQKIIELVDTLLLYHTSMNNFKEAMETTIKFYPNRYSDISYYADCAGYNKISTEFAIKAFQSNPNETNAYNIALAFEENSLEFNKYMKIASDLGSMPAKIVIAIREMTEGNEYGRKLMQEPFDSLFKIYQTDRKNMTVSELDDLLLTSEYLGYTNLTDEVNKVLEQKIELLKTSNVLFQEGNLLKEK